jgi:radical SAM superfamily enzyme YgiQ (UPF0313 family)
MAKVHLVHAGIGTCKFNSYGRGMDESWINHGLASIGAYLKLKSYDFAYLDLRKIKGWKHLSRVIKNEQPDFIAISATTVDYSVAKKTALLAKDISSDTVTILGGIHASVCPEQCAQDGIFDHIVIGEGERVLPEIITQNVKDTIIQGKLLDRLDDLPYIDRKIFGNEETPIYPKLFPEPFTTFIASRGCPYNCSFCQPAERIVFGRKMRTRSPENLVGEIEKCILESGTRSYLIHDDCLIWDVEWTENFVRILQKKNIEMPFAIQARADLICKNFELIRKLAEAGLTMALIGFESGSQRILDFLRKGTSVEQNIEAARICHENGIAIWANYMLGIPGETRNDMEQTVSMVRKINPTVYSPSYFTPYPGSDLYKYCAERHLSLLERPEDYRRNPWGEKIKGVNYRHVKRAVRLSMDEHILMTFLNKMKHYLKRLLKI